MELFNINISDIRKDRVLNYYERDKELNLPNDDEQFSEKPNFDDAPRILLDLESNQETNIHKSYSNLIQLCYFNYDFPPQYFSIVLNHTLSTNPSIAESSQGFLIFLFRKHPMQAQYFFQIDILNYFNELLALPFTRNTVAFLMTIFKKKLLDTKSFLKNFFNLLFKYMSDDFTSADFFHRLDFIQLFLYILPDFNKIIIDDCTQFILQCFPLLASFDHDLLCTFLSIISKCMNIEANEEWLYKFISKNYVSALLNLYTDDDYDINLYITWCLCGISGSSQKISECLIPLHIFDFLGNKFINCQNEVIQSLFIRITSNLLIGHDLDYNDFINCQLFQDFITIFDDSSLKIKKEIIRLICYLVLRLRDKFIPTFVELKLIHFFIDALYLNGSFKTKRYVIIAIDTIINVYYLLNKEQDVNAHDQLQNSKCVDLIESILQDMNLIEAIDDFIYENNEPVPSKGLNTAIDVQRALYELNSLES